MNRRWGRLWLLAVALLAPHALAQQEASRNRGITADRPEARPRAEALAPAPPPQRDFCDGANTTNAFNDNTLMGGPIVAIEWTPAAAATITRIEVFTGEATTPVGLAIWSDAGGMPSANLGDTGYFNLPTAINSWQGANLLTPVAVNAGTRYWIVFDPSGGEQAPVQNGTGQQYWGSYAGTITSVPSGSWFGPFSSSDHAWKFRLYCAPRPKDVYAAKFLCGSFLPRERDFEGPVKPGNYLTTINVHNPNPALISFRKKAVLLYRADDPPKPEQPMRPGKLFDARLEDDWGLQIDCIDIRRELLGGMAPGAPTFIEGWVVIEVSGTGEQAEPRPLDVTAVYTSHGWDQRSDRRAFTGFAQDVEVIRPNRVRK